MHTATLLALLLAGTAEAKKPDALEGDPADGCPAIDNDAGSKDYGLEVYWRLQPGADKQDLQPVEIQVTTPVGGLHLVPEGSISLGGKEALTVPTGSDGCARTAMVQSKLSGRDKDGARLTLRAGEKVQEVSIAVRFQEGVGAPHTIDLTQPARSVVNTSTLEVTVLVTPLDIELMLEPDGEEPTASDDAASADD